MDIANIAYYKPFTTTNPGIQREGFSTDVEDHWYDLLEKVAPRKYHKYAKASLIEKLYGVNEDDVEPIPDDPEPIPIEPDPTPAPDPEPDPTPDPEPDGGDGGNTEILP